MVEEKKLEGGDGKNNTTNTNEEKENQVEERENEIVLNVDMHCQACAKKIVRVVRHFPGVEDVGVDRKANRVVVKAQAEKTVDAAQLCDKIQKKMGRKAQILSPMAHLPPHESQPKDDTHNQKDHHQPPVVTVAVALQVHMHCEACAQVLRKRIRKIKGIESVETDVGKDEVMVKGVIGDPSDLVKQVCKRTGKQVSILVLEDVEKKQHGDNDHHEKEKEDDDNHISKENKDMMINNSDGSGKQEVELADHNMTMMSQAINTSYNYNIMDYYTSNSNLNNYHPDHQVFSDENPNACTIM